VKNELEKVRNWAAAKLTAGAVRDSSWPQYVRLVETIDGVLRDISVAENASGPRRETVRAFRMLEPIDQSAEDVARSESRMRRKAGSLR
jgi:hypothetical protein